ncbi:FtsX-like permease family protein [Mucilaginibacter corticis]|uniref:FtsX-like permease family protein n=1 Tax=Mucilaginibacter corticis TaxID=2597670 RepID=A0A556MMD1_9SPHI|nr:ABC transporter permease [Mucilaginibacter corticis]TSJ41080.1 FtsX-like permease family protein [Mucilaginibacter corticis]
MIKNYLRIVFRNLAKHTAFSFINIVGLAVGMAACLLILQYVSFELSYDNFQAKGDRLYRINQDRYTGGKLSTSWAAGASAAGPAFKAAFPNEIEDYVKLISTGKLLVTYQGKSIVIPNNFLVGANFFKMFSYPLLQGDVNTVLNEPRSVVLSVSMAKKLFGDVNAMGKNVTLFNRPLKVTGIMQDMPKNSHLNLEIMESYATLKEIFGVPPTEDVETRWFNDGFIAYVLLKPGVNPRELEKKFVPIADKGMAEWPNERAKFTLQPVKDIHLYSNRKLEVAANGDGKSVYLLLAIAIFVIVIAWINYINLATARGMARAKEVGVRKTLGSAKTQLIGQFLFEAILLNGLAMLLAVVIIAICLPGFAAISGMAIGFSLFAQPAFWLWVFGVWAVGSLFSGFYPAIVLSNYKPVEVLKGKLANTSGGVVLRQSLVVVQFAASIFLLIGALTVYKQITFMQDQKLGVNIDQTVVIRSPLIKLDSLRRDTRIFKEATLALNNVKGVTVSSDVPGSEVFNNVGALHMAGQTKQNDVQCRLISMDYDFLKNYGIKIIAGRDYSPQFPGDEETFIVNRSATKLFGFKKPEDMIGKQIVTGNGPHTVVGVTEDYHQQSLRDNYDAVIFDFSSWAYGNVSVKIGSGNVSQTIASLKANWAKYFPGDPFEYEFLDSHFNEQYKADQRFAHVFGIFTLIAIFVACLGLFGLVSYTIVQRTKEIGIRKVLGASVNSILQLLYKDFAMLILIAFVLAAPIAWYAIHQWLNHYAFRMSINPFLFLLPFVAVVGIAFATVSWLSIKAALTNPVKSLKTE